MTTTHDVDGQVIASTDAIGHTMHYEYDDAERRVKVTDALGQETAYGYNVMRTRTWCRSNPPIPGREL